MRHWVKDWRVWSLWIGVLACSLLLTQGCGRRRALSPSGSSGELPDQEVGDFAVTETDEGKPQWKLYAGYAALYNARNLIQVRGVHVDFYDDRGERSSVLTAREGELNERTHNMTARGSVVLQATEGTRLSTEELRFMNRENKILVPVEQLVRVERTGDILTGYGFESDPDLRHYEFKHQVQATVRPRSNAIGRSPGATKSAAAAKSEAPKSVAAPESVKVGP